MREQAKTPESSFQRAYLRQKKREREQVRVFRALLLVSFLVLWEVAADLRWIDPFIFSSPVRVGKTFVTLLTEQNLLRHIGIFNDHAEIAGASTIVLGLLTLKVAEDNSSILDDDVVYCFVSHN